MQLLQVLWLINFNADEVQFYLNLLGTLFGILQMWTTAWASLICDQEVSAAMPVFTNRLFAPL